jgi:2-oxoglutarate dehydrogenase E2 component (dihydrolipoamide succinyltransferase)
MSVELKVPQVGESITEVQIGDWLKSEGDAVASDEAVVVIETDKVTVELPAPAAGTLARVLKKKGESAKVGEVIGYLEAGAAAPKAPAPDAPKAKGAKPAAEKSAAAEKPAAAKAAAKPAAEKTAAQPEAEKEPSAQPERAAHVMPAAARALAQSGRSAADVAPSGPGNRVQKYDVEGPTAKASAPAPRAAAPTDGAALEELVPMTPLRRRVAERLVEAQRTAAILTTFNEIDMTAVRALRQAQQERFTARHGVKLGFMSFFVKAAVEALKLVPGVNAEIRGTDIVYKNHYDIGVAVGGGKGLVVPVLRQAERLSFAEVEQAIADLAARARDNKLTLEELTGGTFTISNGGIYGSLLSTPILNPPQSGILGLHAIQDRPVAIEGQVVIRPMMYVALSYDHRLVDGREAVTFLKHVKECLEEPARILLEI